MTIHAVDVIPDHAHLFVESGPTLSVSATVNRFKCRTRRILREEFPRLPTRWSRGTFARMAGSVSRATIRRYIEAQRGV